MLRICMPTSEFAPFAKTGGLADVTAGLSDYLARMGQDVRVFMPFYRDMPLDGVELRTVDFLQNVPLPVQGRIESFSVCAARVPETEQWIYLLQCRSLFERDGIYRNDGDEHVRFSAFSRMVLETCQRMGCSPHIIHCIDWHTALIPLYLRTKYKWDDLFQSTRTVMTIHNIGYQGVYGADTLHDLELAEYANQLHQDDYRQGRISFLRHGIMLSDVVTTVSRRYAQEIQTSEFGMGLERDLRARHDHLVGIVNGVDYAAWNPAHDPHLAQSYHEHDLSGKARCRAALLESLGLHGDPSGPVIGVVSRLTWQKGFEYAYGPLAELLGTADVRLVALGSGEDRDEQAFYDLQRRFPGKACFWRGYNNALAHQIEAGSDLFLMPSRFEPCGLNQMYSVRYGTPPIVRATGGLADTVQHWNPHDRTGNGFVFEHADEGGVRWALSEALRAWMDRPGWEALMRNGMQSDFSWNRQGREYLQLYARL